MKPIAKVFSRDNPCRKIDIWNCFRIATGFRRVSVPEAHSYIGVNVPRVMESQGRLVRDLANGTDYYVLTEEGREWLYEGFQRYLKNHPSHAPKAHHLPSEWGYTVKPVKLRRTR